MLVRRPKLSDPEQFSPGPLRAYYEWVHDLWLQAGEPSSHELAEELGCSHTTVARLFKRLPPKRRRMYLMLQYLYAHPRGRATERSDQDWDRFHAHADALLAEVEGLQKPVRSAAVGQATGGGLLQPAPTIGPAEHRHSDKWRPAVFVPEKRPGAGLYGMGVTLTLDDHRNLDNGRLMSDQMAHVHDLLAGPQLGHISMGVSPRLGGLNYVEQEWPFDVFCLATTNFSLGLHSSGTFLHFDEPASGIRVPFELSAFLPRFRRGFVLVEGAQLGRLDEDAHDRLESLVARAAGDDAKRLVMVYGPGSGGTFAQRIAQLMSRAMVAPHVDAFEAMIDEIVVGIRGEQGIVDVFLD
ncbi:hypothetical protein [Streptomyces tanashiensis]|uniref:hypothetical protein n=1 Tax=Streptomyces tanashiensis TaxID=67367 RepID=UPI0033F9B17C